MPIVVRVVSQEDYDKWVADQQAKAGTAITAAATATATDAPPVAAAQTAATVADGKTVYEQACQLCHAAGVAGAPKTGDQAAWAPRSAKGMDVLYGHAIGGFNMMPAKGGNAALTDEQVKAAVDHMLAQSR